MARVIVRDLAHLIELASRPDGLDCYIELGESGMFTSSKTIRYVEPGGRYGKTGKFDVYNAIDDSWQVLWPKQLWTLSHIGEAMDKGALVIDN